MQGAAFSGGTLHQQSPNDPEVAGVPDVTLAYVHKDKPRPYQVGAITKRVAKVELKSMSDMFVFAQPNAARVSLFDRTSGRVETSQ